MPVTNSGNSISPAKAAMLLLLLASFVAAFYPVWKELVQSWSQSEDYSHGFLIIPLCLYFIWRKRETLKQITVSPSRGGFLLVGASLLIYLGASLGEILTLASLSMLLVMASAVVYLWNFAVLKNLGFIFFLMLFMIPVPEQIYSQITIQLQLFVTKISVAIATLAGISVYREGNVINLPNQALQVVIACSGIRSLMTLLTLSAVLGYLNLRSNFLRGALLASALPAAIVINIIRVSLTIGAFYYFNYDLTDGSVHTLFGILIFILAFALLFAVNKALVVLEKPLIKETADKAGQ